MNNNHKPIVVTTEHRGVFFGYVSQDADLTAKTMRLEQCRMCVYWPSEQHGVLGLAAGSGPMSGSKITPAIPALTIHDITAVAECTQEAAEGWEQEPWN